MSFENQHRLRRYNPGTDVLLYPEGRDQHQRFMRYNGAGAGRGALRTQEVTEHESLDWESERGFGPPRPALAGVGVGQTKLSSMLEHSRKESTSRGLISCWWSAASMLSGHPDASLLRAAWKNTQRRFKVFSSVI